MASQHERDKFSKSLDLLSGKSLGAERTKVNGTNYGFSPDDQTRLNECGLETDLAKIKEAIEATRLSLKERDCLNKIYIDGDWQDFKDGDTFATVLDKLEALAERALK